MRTSVFYGLQACYIVTAFTLLAAQAYQGANQSVADGAAFTTLHILYQQQDGKAGHRSKTLCRECSTGKRRYGLQTQPAARCRIFVSSGRSGTAPGGRQEHSQVVRSSTERMRIWPANGGSPNDDWLPALGRPWMIWHYCLLYRGRGCTKPALPTK